MKEVAERAGGVWIAAELGIAEELAKLPKAKGGQPYQKSTGPKAAPVDAPTLAELGVAKKHAARARRIARAILSGRQIECQDALNLGWGTVVWIASQERFTG